MDIEALNRGLFLAMNAPAGLAGAPLDVAIGAARYSVALLAAILVWHWLRGTARDRRVLMHVALAVVPALALNYALGLALIAVALAALTSGARVFLGLHFPFDIVGSMAVAVSVIAALAPRRVLIEARIVRPVETICIGAIRRFAHRDRQLPTAHTPPREHRMNSTFGQIFKENPLP